MTGLWVLLAAALLTAALAVAHRLLDGRFRGTRPIPHAAEPPRHSADLTHFVRGERFTLLQFSSAFCAPCRATRVILKSVADLVPGVAHVEIDADENLELVRTLHILKTPTTLVLDADGREVTRASGQPTRNAVLIALGQAVPS